LTLIPNSNYVGPIEYLIVASSSADWYLYTQFFPKNQWPPYDWQYFRFVIGDTGISAIPASVTATPQVGFTNQLLATFTNGVPNSSTGSFTATINWGDNSITVGTISTNNSGRKEVRGTHTYVNSGNYPIYITITSALGASATVVAQALVRPSLSFAQSGNQMTLRWPAWASDFQLQFHTNLSTANWSPVTNVPTLVGYENTVTNSTTAPGFFYRLRR
jgi:hypothetical protein